MSVKRRPREPAHLGVDAHARHRDTVAVDDARIGDDVRRAHVVEGGRPPRSALRDRTASDDGASNRITARTFHATFGISPNISGAYIASTRVAGRLNVPGLLRRTVYSVTNVPFGT